jgi:uncharacterized protein with FMN-binding domain
MRGLFMHNRSLFGFFVLLPVFFFSGCVFFEMSDFAKNTEIETPDLSSIPDGIYTGTCKSGIVEASVELAVNDHSIIDFKILKHKTGLGRSAESLAQTVIQKQSLEVDTVSGATISSKVILKAAENALNSFFGK